jgi:cellulose synthase (UDP-forming)
MRLNNRPQASNQTIAFKPKSASPAINEQNVKRNVSPWVLALFSLSICIFCFTFYTTAWSSSGPTLIPIEQSQPGPNLALDPFARLSPLQPASMVGARQLPEWLHPPTYIWELVGPVAVVTLLSVGLRFIPSNNLTRLPIKLLTLGLMVRYMAWRLLGDTMNFTTLLSSGLSLWLVSAELYSFAMLILSTFQTIWSSKARRTQEANRYERQILAGEYLPSVDILVPSYNEAEFIIRRTVMGVQALDYPNKTVYICDDARRPNVRRLAQELGCNYITQPDGFINPHAKAGNLNNALKNIQGELIMVVDADFVPFKHFLMRTVGFFQNPKVALVQTPQDFYNPDYHVRNLGVAHAMPNDLQLFFQHQQSMMDAAKSSICCGTSYVVRRRNLDEVGGYYTGCIPEDSSTSMIFMTRGYEVVYLNEKLSMGESPRNYRDFMNQRLRWLQGNLQIFLRIKDIPLWTGKMNWVQKSYMLTMIMGAFQPFVRFTYLISPLVCLYLGVSNYFASAPEVVYYTLPPLILMMGTFSWTSNYHASHFYNEIYDFMMCFPSVVRIIQTLRAPFKGAFKVTAKGVTAEQKNYNFPLTWPLILVMGLTLAILLIQLVGQRASLWNALDPEQFGLIYGWMAYNIVWMIVAILAAIDQPERRRLDRFPLKAACHLKWTDVEVWGYTQDLSESGTKFTVFTPEPIPEGVSVRFELLEAGCVLQAQVVRSERGRSPQGHMQELGLQFDGLTLLQHRKISALLYSSPTWWKASRRIGSLDSLLMFLGALFKFRPALTDYSPR